jgi:outer membrane protein
VKYTLCIFLLFSNQVLANFQSLGVEFLNSNTAVQNTIGSVIKADEAIKFVESKLAGGIEGQVGYIDNDSDSANSVNFAAGKTTSVDLNFTKATSWGGVFSLNNSFEKVIQDPSRILIFGGDPEIHQFKQSLSFSTSLSRNLFGQNYKLMHNSSILNAEYVDLLSQSSVNNLFLQFSQTYSRAVLHNELFSLQEEALKRSVKRLSLVKRRVSDGINLRADLLRAESAKIFQEEQLDQSRQDLNQSLFALSSLVHRQVKRSELGVINDLEEQAKLTERRKQNLEKVELSIGARKTYADYQELEKNIKARAMLPNVDFAVAYQTNDYDADSSSVFEDGSLAGDKNTISVGLTFSYNLGRVSEKAQLIQAEVNHNQALHQLSAEYETNKEKRVMLEDNLYISSEKSRKASRRVELSLSIIQEYVKLFSLGRVTLDQVIQAEEDLINSQKRFAQQAVVNFSQRLELVSLDYFIPELIKE